MTEVETQKNEPFVSLTRLGFFDGIRTLLLISVAILTTAFDPSLALNRTAWIVAIATVGTCVIAAQLLRAWQISKSRELIELHELFLYLIVALIGFAALLFVEEAALLPNLVDLRISTRFERQLDPLSLLTWSVLFLGSFLPLLLAIFRIEARPVRGNKKPIFRGDVVSVPTLVITTVIVALIATLAWAAGSGRFELGQQVNVLTMTVVVGGFLAVILVPNMVQAWNDWSERTAATRDGAVANNLAVIPLTGLRFSARLMSYLDSLLVKLLAPLSGATQKGFMVPHALVVLVILPLSAMGFVLAAPFGLIPISLAALIALSLGRRWAWVEQDREIASRLQSTDPKNADIKVGFENDLKDEALLGYASLFVLVPLALYQIQGALNLFDATGNSTGNPFLDWFSFFGAELAKAVPFVDWWEIYNVDVNVPFEASDRSGGEWARHLTFAARAIVDLVIMAALFQALSIWQRSRTQRLLYANGELNAFDPFTEKEFFNNGMHTPAGYDTPQPKRQFRKKIEDHIAARTRLNLEPLPYSRDRLGELIKSDVEDDLRFGAEWMIRKYEVLAGANTEQLEQLAQRWVRLEYRPHFQSNSDEARFWIREQKRELERILDGLIQSNKVILDENVSSLANVLQAAHGHPEFGYARILSFELLAGKTTFKSAALLGCHLLNEEWPDEVRKTLLHSLAAPLGIPPRLFLGQGKMRIEVCRALVRQYEFQGMRAQRLIRELLEGTAQYDRDGSTRDEAKRLLASIR